MSLSAHEVDWESSACELSEHVATATVAEEEGNMGVRSRRASSASAVSRASSWMPRGSSREGGKIPASSYISGADICARSAAWLSLKAMADADVDAGIAGGTTEGTTVGREWNPKGRYRNDSNRSFGDAIVDGDN